MSTTSTAEIIRLSTDVAEKSITPSEQLRPASVAVLLCTYHGDLYLGEQLDSIGAQLHDNVRVWASDDGSSDSTQEILDEYQHHWGEERLSVHSGPRQGFVKNFLSLLGDINIQADYFAYADQDDIWEHDKLSRAIEKLQDVPDDVPALYCSRTRLIDQHGHVSGFTPVFEKKPAFANALIQNIGGGNTMVLNKAAREILSAMCDIEVVNHDWWAYIVVTGVGGKVIYDPYPTVKYRQHGNNLIGANTSWRARLYRIRMLLKGRFRQWNTINTDALQHFREILTPENRYILDQFCIARNRWFLPRMWGLWRSGIYRQTLLGNIGIIVGALLKKV